MKSTFWFHWSLKKRLLQTFFKLIQISFKIEATQSQLPLVLLQTRTTNLRGVLHDLEEGRFEISSKDAPTLGLLKSSIQVGFNRCFILDENIAWMYLQLPLRQWGAGNANLLVLSSWKVNIAENLIAVMGL